MTPEPVLGGLIDNAAQPGAKLLGLAVSNLTVVEIGLLDGPNLVG